MVLPLRLNCTKTDNTIHSVNSLFETMPLLFLWQLWLAVHNLPQGWESHFPDFICQFHSFDRLDFSDVYALSKCADPAACALSKCADPAACALSKCADPAPAHLASAQVPPPAHLASAQVPPPAHLASAQDLLRVHLASAHDLFFAKNPNFRIRV
ncbi:hypothetical protein L1987_42525 [Smallanthus sonchifolius]|uniref:Uncharacterized protein n=1 Tax=Smallanthus sonchifolius TaxID=185202 RepID=A0ACB9GIW8_9ASTR|nr:hypothetical protein L1987_42525 [Smallanthus sonchifolius]